METKLTENQKFKILNNLDKKEKTVISKVVESIFGDEFFQHVRCKLVYWILRALCERLLEKGIFTDYSIDAGLADGCRIYIDDEHDSIELYSKQLGSRLSE